MSVTGLDSLDKTVHKTNEWLSGIMHDMPTESRREAYVALRSVLHALRDRLPLPIVVSFGAQLPLLVRGIYYDGWHPDGKGLHLRSVEEFLALIERDIPPGSPVESEAAVRAVFGVIERHLDPSETTKVIHVLPKAIQQLWGREPSPRDS